MGALDAIDSPARQRVVRDTAAALEPAVGELAEDVAREIRDQIPELSEDETMPSSCRGNISLKLSMLRNGLAPAGVDAPVEARHYARDVASRGGDLGALLHSYRIGHSWFWRTWTGALTSRVQDPVALLELGAAEHTAAFLFAYFDSVCGQIEAEYKAGLAQRRTDRPTLRELVRTILAGGETDVEAASRSLGYDLRRHHIALILHADAEGPEEPPAAGALGRAGRALASELGSRDPLLVPAGDAALWIWVPCDGSPDVEALERVSLLPALLAADVAVGIGEPGRGLDGFRRSHDEAAQALRMATFGSRRRRAVRYGNVAVASLLSADIERAARFIERELDGLSALDDTTARLRATVKVYLEEGSNQARTARRLGLHYNTVGYRIRRAEELLGRPISVRRFELEAALSLAYALGDAAVSDECRAASARAAVSA